MTKKEKGYKKPVATQLPSGSWRCRVRVDGKDITITRQTRKEAEAEAMAVKYGIIEARNDAGRKMTLGAAIDAYIEARTGALSPATLTAYRAYRTHAFQSLMGCDIYTTQDAKFQNAIKAEQKRYSAKYIRNCWGLIAAAIREASGREIRAKLPPKAPTKKEYLRPKQIMPFVEAVHGRPVEIPALMALCSLRLSEILAVTWDDVDFQNNCIRVHGSRVRSGSRLVDKAQNKNATSRRTVPMIPQLRAALEAVPDKTGLVIKKQHNWIYKAINEVCDELGYPHVGNHGLRHSFASLAYHLQIPEKIAMEIGGWANDQTMHKIYTHLAEEDIASRAAAFVAFFNPDKKTE